ncbi:fimbrial protein [Citrobacter portucalensis]|uniref:fimbrial protein n=1 Tax=Citrobacter portucalensis TaxID=1639133 RepID=UPI003C2FB07D
MKHSHTSIHDVCRTPLLAVACLVLGGIQCAQADAVITFHGKLNEAPPCVVNGNELIKVDFGDEVMTTRLDGKNYRQEVRFKVDCSAATSNYQRVRISGPLADFNLGGKGLLNGGQNGFGLALYNGENPMAPGEWINFTAPTVPPLFVVPVKKDGESLGEGYFRTLASLVVDYQ